MAAPLDFHVLEGGMAACGDDVGGVEILFCGYGEGALLVSVSVSVK